jgi:regulatory protein YycH of two-component signal transduction system YycFG
MNIENVEKVLVAVFCILSGALSFVLWASIVCAVLNYMGWL